MNLRTRTLFMMLFAIQLADANGQAVTSRKREPAGANVTFHKIDEEDVVPPPAPPSLPPSSNPTQFQQPRRQSVPQVVAPPPAPERLDPPPATSVQTPQPPSPPPARVETTPPPTRVEAPPPPPPPEEVEQVETIPKCNPRDPKAFTNKWKVIDDGLKSVAGYNHGFNKNWQLGEASWMFNQCRAKIQNGSYGPEIATSNCYSLQEIGTRSVKACQFGTRIRFVEDTSVPSGFRGAPRSPIVVDIESAGPGQWTVYYRSGSQNGSTVVVEVPTGAAR